MDKKTSAGITIKNQRCREIRIPQSEKARYYSIEAVPGMDGQADVFC